ncbi:hypothetical protein PQQ53_21125, partial [Paraburkholderia strydomiana]
AGCGLRAAGCGLRAAGCGLRASGFGLKASDKRRSDSGFRLPARDLGGAEHQAIARGTPELPGEPTRNA